MRVNRARWAWPILATLTTFIAYSRDSGRALSYDGAGTRGNFIATSSIFDPFRRQVGYNNHVVFSFLDHLVYSAGLHSVASLRVLPEVFAALTVGLVALITNARFGLLASIVAAVFLGLNPSFVEAGREVRGYSLVVFAAVVASVILVRLTAGPPTRLLLAGYVFAVAVAIGTHLFAAGLLVPHVAYILSRKATSQRRLLLAAGAAAGLGALPILALLPKMLRYQTHASSRAFHTRFPVDEIKALLGVSDFTGHEALVGLEAIPVVAGLYWACRSIAGRAVLVASLAVLAAAWLAAPSVLSPRFFDWLLPGAAFLAAAGVHSAKLTAFTLPAVVVLSIMQFRGVNSWNDQRYAWDAAARFVHDQAAQGRQVCAPQTVSLDDPFVGYSHEYRRVNTVAELAQCRIVIRVVEITKFGDELKASFVRVRTFPAWFPAEVYVRKGDCSSVPGVC